MEPARAYVSSCLLDTTTVFLPVDARSIQKSLSSFPGARLERSSGRPDDPHPIWLEFARVREGRLEQQDQWARGIGTFLGPFAGAFADAWNAGLSASLGTYHEVMIGVPDVRLSGNRSGPFMLVFGMYTDSPIAKWGDGVLRCGYRKRMARLSRNGFEEYRVADEGGAELLRMTAGGHAEKPSERASDIAGFEIFRSRLEQPLLGHLGGRDYAMSTLERRYPRDVVGRSVDAEIVSIEGARDLLEPARHQLVAGAKPGYGALQFAGVPARLTYPEHFVAASE